MCKYTIHECFLWQSTCLNKLTEAEGYHGYPVPPLEQPVTRHSLNKEPIYIDLKSINSYVDVRYFAVSSRIINLSWEPPAYTRNSLIRVKPRYGVSIITNDLAIISHCVISPPVAQRLPGNRADRSNIKSGLDSPIASVALWCMPHDQEVGFSVSAGGHL